jgi:hypothetical protein
MAFDSVRERGEPMDEQALVRTKRISTYALVVVSLVAVVVMVVVLMRQPPEPELTTAPTTTSAEPDPAAPDPAAPVENDVVEEPVDPNADIPGCDTVEAPDEGGLTAIASMGNPSYDNPKFPWFSGPKATAMSNALAELLPDGAEIEFASETRSLVFQPITDFGDAEPAPKGSTHASGSVVNGDGKGGVFVSVQLNPGPIPPCVAGSLDERRTLPDGTVVDVHDTWRETNGVRALSRSAMSYVSDGSWISASAYDNFGDTQQEHSGTIPLTIDDLVRIVSDPRLRVSTAVPPGTPAPSEECEGAGFGTAGPVLTHEQARKLDAVLAPIDLGGAKLAPLRPGDSSNTTLCTGLSNVRGVAELDISIVGGQPLPTPERPQPGSGGQKTLRTLADGTVVQTDHSYRSGAPMGKPEEATSELINSVVVTRTGGTQISVSSSAPAATDVLPLGELESIALTPGLEL